MKGHLVQNPIKSTFRYMIFAILTVLLTSAVFADSATETEIVPGLTYREFDRNEGPWAIQVLELDRSEKSLTISAALGRDHILGIEPLDSLMIRTEAKVKNGGSMDVLAAINADFYVLKHGPFQGDPVGLCVWAKQLVSSPIKRSTAVFTVDGGVEIGRFAFKSTLTRENGASFPIRGVNQSCSKNGIVLISPLFGKETRPQPGMYAVAIEVSDSVEITGAGEKNTFTVREKALPDSVHSLKGGRHFLLGRGEGADFLKSLKTGEDLTCSLGLDPFPGEILNAVGGTPRLIRNGAISIEAEEENIGKSFVTSRHPRTAFGYNDSSMFFVTVDGRRPGHSAGMSLPELADLMMELGATEALNLDGGGSTTMWVDGVIKNRPSDNRIRPISNALMIYRNK